MYSIILYYKVLFEKVEQHFISLYLGILPVAIIWFTSDLQSRHTAYIGTLIQYTVDQINPQRQLNSVNKQTTLINQFYLFGLVRKLCERKNRSDQLG